jgi:signal transduction histidine kinase
MRHLNEVRAHASLNPARRVLADEVDRAARAYFVVWDEAEMSRANGAAAMARATRPLDAALGAAMKLVRYDEARLDTARLRNPRLDRVVMALSIFIGVLALGGIAAVVAILRRRVIGPVLRLTESIHRYAHGDRSERAHRDGAPEIAAASAGFNDMADTIQGQHRHMAEFLDRIARDLRDPVEVAHAALDELARAQPMFAEDRIRARANVALKALSQIDRAVFDFVDAHRLESERVDLHLERRDIREFVRKSVEILEDAADVHHQFMLDMPDDAVMIECDQARIAEMTNNLLANAIQYSPHGGVVKVRVSQSDHRASLDVVGYGGGIAEGDLQRMFEPYKRITALQHDPGGGAGFGLSISRRIAEAHGGHLDVSSKQGECSTFHVELPVTPAR